MSILWEENEKEISFYKEFNFCTVAAPSAHYQILHLEQIIIVVTRYEWQNIEISITFSNKFEMYYLFACL